MLMALPSCEYIYSDALACTTPLLEAGVCETEPALFATLGCEHRVCLVGSLWLRGRE